VECSKGLMQRAERITTLALSAILDPLFTSMGFFERGNVLLAGVVLVATGSLGTAIFQAYSIAQSLDAVRRPGGSQ
jgi:hypothetical protein